MLNLFMKSDGLFSVSSVLTSAAKCNKEKKKTVRNYKLNLSSLTFFLFFLPLIDSYPFFLSRSLPIDDSSDIHIKKKRERPSFIVGLFEEPVLTPTTVSAAAAGETNPDRGLCSLKPRIRSPAFVHTVSGSVSSGEQGL